MPGESHHATTATSNGPQCLHCNKWFPKRPWLDHHLLSCKPQSLANPPCPVNQYRGMVPATVQLYQESPNPATVQHNQESPNPATVQHNQESPNPATVQHNQESPNPATVQHNQESPKPATVQHNQESHSRAGIRAGIRADSHIHHNTGSLKKTWQKSPKDVIRSRHQMANTRGSPKLKRPCLGAAIRSSCPLCYNSRHKFKSLWHLGRHMNAKHKRISKQSGSTHNQQPVQAQQKETQVCGSKWDVSSSLYPTASLPDEHDTSVLSNDGRKLNPFKCALCPTLAAFKDIGSLSDHARCIHSPKLVLQKFPSLTSQHVDKAWDMNPEDDRSRENVSPLKLYLWKCVECAVNGHDMIYRSHQDLETHICAVHEDSITQKPRAGNTMDNDALPSNEWASSTNPINMDLEVEDTTDRLSHIISALGDRVLTGTEDASDKTLDSMSDSDDELFHPVFEEEMENASDVIDHVMMNPEDGSDEMLSIHSSVDDAHMESVWDAEDDGELVIDEPDYSIDDSSSRMSNNTKRLVVTRDDTDDRMVSCNQFNIGDEEMWRLESKTRISALNCSHEAKSSTTNEDMLSHNSQTVDEMMEDTASCDGDEYMVIDSPPEIQMFESIDWQAMRDRLSFKTTVQDTDDPIGEVNMTMAGGDDISKLRTVHEASILSQDQDKSTTLKMECYNDDNYQPIDYLLEMSHGKNENANTDGSSYNRSTAQSDQMSVDNKDDINEDTCSMATDESAAEGVQASTTSGSNDTITINIELPVQDSNVTGDRDDEAVDRGDDMKPGRELKDAGLHGDSGVIDDSANKTGSLERNEVSCSNVDLIKPAVSNGSSIEEGMSTVSLQPVEATMPESTSAKSKSGLDLFSDLVEAIMSDTDDTTTACPSDLSHHYTVHLNSLEDRLAMIKKSPSGKYKCLICHEHLNGRIMPLVHMRSHTDKYPYHCSLCKFKSSFKSAMLRHLGTSHEIQEPEGAKRRLLVSESERDMKRKTVGESQKDEMTDQERENREDTLQPSPVRSAKKWCHQERLLLKSITSDSTTAIEITNSACVVKEEAVDNLDQIVPGESGGVSDNKVIAENGEDDLDSDLVICDPQSNTVLDNGPTDVEGLSNTSKSAADEGRHLSDNQDTTPASVHQQDNDCSFVPGPFARYYVNECQQNPVVTCPYCRHLTFDDSPGAFAHALSHTKETPYHCRRCTYRSKTLTQMYIHTVNRHNIRQPKLPTWHGEISRNVNADPRNENSSDVASLDTASQDPSNTISRNGTSSLQAEDFGSNQAGIKSSDEEFTSHENTIQHQSLAQNLHTLPKVADGGCGRRNALHTAELQCDVNTNTTDTIPDPDLHQHCTTMTSSSAVRTHVVLNAQTKDCLFIPSIEAQKILIELKVNYSEDYTCLHEACRRKKKLPTMQSAYQHALIHAKEKPYACRNCTNNIYCTHTPCYLYNHLRNYHSVVNPEKLPPASSLIVPIGAFTVPIGVATDKGPGSSHADGYNRDVANVVTPASTGHQISTDVGSSISSSTVRDLGSDGLDTSITPHVVMRSSIAPSPEFALTDPATAGVPQTMRQALNAPEMTEKDQMESLGSDGPDTSITPHVVMRSSITPSPEFALTDPATAGVPQTIRQALNAPEMTEKDQMESRMPRSTENIAKPNMSSKHTPVVESNIGLHESNLTTTEQHKMNAINAVSVQSRLISSSAEQDIPTVRPAVSHATDQVHHLKKSLNRVDFIYSPSTDEAGLWQYISMQSPKFVNCKLCLEQYDTISIFEHWRTAHEKSNPFSCRDCTYKCDKLLDIISHVSSATHLHMVPEVYQVFHICNWRCQDDHQIYNKQSQSALSNPDEIYHCNACNVKTFHLTAMKHHVYASHKKIVGLNRDPLSNRIACSVCMHIWTDLDTALKHQCDVAEIVAQDPNKQQTLNCRFCNYTAKSPAAIRVHASLVHGVSDLRCESLSSTTNQQASQYVQANTMPIPPQPHMATEQDLPLPHQPSGAAPTIAYCGKNSHQQNGDDFLHAAVPRPSINNKSPTQIVDHRIPTLQNVAEDARQPNPHQKSPWQQGLDPNSLHQSSRHLGNAVSIDQHDSFDQRSPSELPRNAPITAVNHQDHHVRPPLAGYHQGSTGLHHASMQQSMLRPNQTPLPYRQPSASTEWIDPVTRTRYMGSILNGTRIPSNLLHFMDKPPPTYPSTTTPAHKASLPSQDPDSSSSTLIDNATTTVPPSSQTWMQMVRRILPLLPDPAHSVNSASNELRQLLMRKQVVPSAPQAVYSQASEVSHSVGTIMRPSAQSPIMQGGADERRYFDGGLGRLGGRPSSQTSRGESQSCDQVAMANQTLSQSPTQTLSQSPTQTLSNIEANDAQCVGTAAQIPIDKVAMANQSLSQSPTQTLSNIEANDAPCIGTAAQIPIDKRFTVQYSAKLRHSDSMQSSKEAATPNGITEIAKTGLVLPTDKQSETVTPSGVPNVDPQDKTVSSKEIKSITDNDDFLNWVLHSPSADLPMDTEEDLEIIQQSLLDLDDCQEIPPPSPVGAELSCDKESHDQTEQSHDHNQEQVEIGSESLSSQEPVEQMLLHKEPTPIVPLAMAVKSAMRKVGFGRPC